MKTFLSIFGDYLKLYHYPHKNGVKMTAMVEEKLLEILMKNIF